MKSDKMGNDKSKIKTIKNDHNPEFNHEAYFPVDRNGPKNINIDFSDADRFGSQTTWLCYH